MHPVHIPQEQVNDESVLLVEWLAADGTEVKPGQPIATIETSKATTQVEAPQAGYLRHAAVQGTEVRVGAVFCHIAADLTETVPPRKDFAAHNGNDSHTMNAVASAILEVPASRGVDAYKSTAAPAASPEQPGVRFSRRALDLIEQHGLSRESFKGGSLVREGDVLALVEARNSKTNAPTPPDNSSSANAAGPAGAVGVPFRTEELPRMKRVEARYLASGQQGTLASVVSVSCPTHGLKAAVARHPELGGSISGIIIFETARLLRKYPVFNAFHHQGKINYYEQVNIGLAVDAGRGLKVPVIAHADKKGVAEISREVEGLLLNYLTDEIYVASLAGGTFTISDLSGEDVFLFHPLINQAQAAILGVGAEFHLPGSRQGFFNLVLAFDHQLAEGRIAATFLKELRDRMATYESALRTDADTAAGEMICSRCSRTAAELALLNVPLLHEARPAGETALICKDCLIGS